MNALMRFEQQLQTKCTYTELKCYCIPGWIRKAWF